MITHTDIPPVENVQKASEAIIEKSKELKVFSMKTKFSNSQSYKLATFKILNTPQVLNGKLDISEKEVAIKIKSDEIKPNSYGKLVSYAFAVDAIQAYKKEYIQTQGKVENHSKRVFFSKEQIELVLSQENCEGISVFFGLPVSKEVIDVSLAGNVLNEDQFKREVSVLLVGNDINGNPLRNMEELININEDEMIIIEVGGHGKFP